MQKICVYCGSSPGKSPAYREAARTLGSELAKHNIGLVYGGAHVGIMGEIADAVLAAGGEATGVIPRSLMEKELAHTGLTQLHVVDSMHQRKAMMEKLSDGFIALPGGFGTFEELFEVLTWAQLGFHQKPCALLNVAGYYDQLNGFLQHAVDEQFLKEENQQMLLVDADAKKLLQAMKGYQAPKVAKWIKDDEI